MKRILYLVFRSIFRRKYLYLSLMVQLFIAILMLNTSIALLSNSLSLENVTKKSGLVDSSCFFANSKFLGTAELGENFQLEEKLVGLEHLEGLGSVHCTDATIPNDDNVYETFSTSKYLLEKVKFPVSKGTWFASTDSVNGVIPIVIGSGLSKKYPLGSSFKMSIGNINVKIPVKVKVIGIKSRPDYTLRLNSNYLEAMITKNEKSIIMPYNTKMFGRDIIGSSLSVILFPEKNADRAQTLTSWKKELSQVGDVRPFEDVFNVYKESNKKNVYLFLCLGGIVLALTMTGIGSTNALSLISQEKEFAINFMCGMKWEWCVLITLIKDLFVIVIPGVAASIVMLILNKMESGQSIIFGSDQMLITLGICILIFAITSLEPLIRLFRKSPITIIREWV